jgi:glucose-specific phosphotransferase system IIA component
MKIFGKNCDILAPVSGKVVDITEVPDKIFAGKMAGEGVAILAEGDVVIAPVEGVVSLIFESNHAIAISLDNGVELLIHVGIDTVELGGQGFTRLVEEGQKVKIGAPLLKIDRDFIIEKGYSMITPVIITNPQVLKKMEANTGINAIGGQDIILNCRVK